MKYGWNANLSIFPVIPIGLVEPCISLAIKCNIINAANTNGNKKCNAKNLWIVGLLTEHYVDNYNYILYTI